MKLLLTEMFYYCQQRLAEASESCVQCQRQMASLSKQLQSSAAKDRQGRIGCSARTLALEDELARAQSRAAEAERRRQELVYHMSHLTRTRQRLSLVLQPPLNGSAGVGEAAKVDEEVALTLGDIAEADDRVKKYFGILPRDGTQQQQMQPRLSSAAAAVEVKTVRMVKRDSKERSVSRAAAGDDDGELEESSDAAANARHRASSDEPKRRGQEAIPVGNTLSGSLPRGVGLGSYTGGGGSGHGSGGELSSSGSAGDSGIFGSRTMLSQSNRSPAFKLGDFHKRVVTGGGNSGSAGGDHGPSTQSRPNSALSARERLFGSSRESSMSPPTSPGGGSAAGSSVVASPIFKSDTARQIAEEVGRVTGGPRLRRARKQRSNTIGGGNSVAIAEALQAEQARLVRRVEKLFYSSTQGKSYLSHRFL
jgi:hypothetical protein